MRRLGCFGLMLALLLVAGAFFVVQSWGGAGPLTRNTTVLVPQGATLRTAAAELEKAGVIGDASRFLLLARLFGSDEPIRAGEYRVPAGLSQSDVLKLLQGGKTLQRFVTVPEGLPSVLVHEALMKAPQLTGEAKVPIEGTVLPDSYSYQRGDSRAEVLDRMQKAMARYLARAWPKRKPTTVVKTPREALILASIVEKETGRGQDRADISAVFHNRLRIGMLLQTDPTVIYGLGERFDGNLRRSDLRTDTPFNTYTRAGLPPTPIAMPGAQSLLAAVQPSGSKALYFVARGDGSSHFSHSLDEHNRAVNRYQRSP